ncbi:metallo-beta-lactamase domain-containing protein 1 isoform X2 [Lampetra fluviatilis]
MVVSVACILTAFVLFSIAIVGIRLPFLSSTGMAELSKTDNLSTIPGVPYSVHVLREGYCYKDSDNHTHADGTVTLLLSVPGEAERPCAILVDTGGPWAKEELITSLQRTVQGCVQQSLAPSDVLQLVHTVVCTHGHSDHAGNVGLFPHARIIMGFDVSQGDLYETHGLAEGKAYVINPYVQVIPTPGHTCSDVSVVVRDTSVGTVVVAGDVFERSDDDDDWKEHSHDPVTQQYLFAVRECLCICRSVGQKLHHWPMSLFRDTGPRFE